MAEGTFKLLGIEAACNTTAVSFSNSTINAGLMKITNLDTAAHLVTLAYANGTTYATTTVLSNVSIYIQKNYTDLISSNAATAVVMATPVKRGTI